MSAYVIPLIILGAVLFATVKKVDVYDSITAGAKEGAITTLAVFPCLVSVFVMLELMSVSGLTRALIDLVSPLLTPLGIPAEVAELVVLRPLSGSGALAVTEQIVATLGADTYAARCACVIMGSSETVLYVTAVYFSRSSVKKTGITVPVSIISSFLAAVLACALLRIM